MYLRNTSFGSPLPSMGPGPPWLWLVPSLCLSTTTALLASNGYAHRRVVFRQSLRCSADSDPVSDSAGNEDDTGGLSAGDGASMGDLLAALASQQQGALPLEDLVDETRGSIDAMLEFGSDELDEIAYEVRSPKTDPPAFVAPQQWKRDERPCAPVPHAPLRLCDDALRPARSSPSTCAASSATRAARPPRGASRPSRQATCCSRAAGIHVATL